MPIKWGGNKTKVKVTIKDGQTVLNDKLKSTNNILIQKLGESRYVMAECNTMDFASSLDLLVWGKGLSDDPGLAP